MLPLQLVNHNCYLFIYLVVNLDLVVSELSPCPTVFSKVFGRCRRPRGKTFLICRLGPVTYQDSVHSPYFYRGIQAMSSSERKTFLVLNIILKDVVSEETSLILQAKSLNYTNLKAVV